MDKSPRDMMISNVHHMFDLVSSMQDEVAKKEKNIEELANILMNLVEANGGEMRFNIHNNDILQGSKLKLEVEEGVVSLKILKPATGLRLVPKEEGEDNTSI